MLVVKRIHADAGGDLLAFLQIEDVDQILPLRGSARLGDVVRLLRLYLARVREHQQVGVTVDRNHVFDEVLVLRPHADDASAASVLRGVGVGGLTFDVARVRQRNHAAVPLDQILQNDLVLRLYDLGAARVGVLRLDFAHLVLDNLLDLALVRENRLQFFYQVVETEQLVLDLLALQTRQLAERHFHNRLRLRVGQRKALHQRVFGVGNRLRRLHDLHDLVDVVNRNLVALEDVRPRPRLVQIELRAAGDDRLLMRDVMVENLRQGQHLRLVVDNRQHIDGKGVLQLRVLVKLVEQDLRVHVAAVLHHNAHTVSARFVAQLGNAVDLLLVHAVGNRLAEHTLVDPVRDFGKDDVPLVLVNLRARPHHDVSLARQVRLFNPVDPVNDGGGGEIRTFDVFHQFIHRAVGVIHAVIHRVDDLAEVVRWNIGRHADRNADAAVDQQVREAAGQNRRLLQTVIEVGHHGNDVLVEIPHHFVGNAVEPRLGVTVCGRRVTVHRTEVSVPLHKRVPQGEWLCQTNHRAVDRRVAVRMVTTQHVTDRGCRLAEGLGVGQTVLIHCVEDTPLTRLHAVADIGERT